VCALVQRAVAVTLPDPPAPVAGELLKIDDRMTGFSPDNPKENRPYVVIAQTGRRVRVVPQSTRGSSGVHIPDGAVDCLEEGWFVPWSTTIKVHLATQRPLLGYLPAEYLDRVREQWQRPGGRP
jgi:hypothetical protein